MRTKLTFPAFYLCLLSAAILGTIYLAWLSFPLEIAWQNLPGSASRIMKNMNVLMDYLTNPFRRVLDMPDYPSSPQGLHHFESVKYLFHLTQLVFVISLPGAWDFSKKVLAKGYGRLFAKPIAWLMALPLIIGGVVTLVGFDTFFVIFHQLLFVGDQTWLFDPANDPVIMILPESFFLHCFILFLCLYELFLGIVYVFMRKGNVNESKTKID